MDHLPTSALASARTMDELIIPALRDADDARALEQAHLIRDLLLFVAERAHLIGPRLDLQLRQAIDLASAVLEQLSDRSGPAGAALAAVVDEVRTEPPFESRSPNDRLQLIDRLNAAASEAVREVGRRGDRDATGRARLAALAAIEARIEVDRAWLAPMGFDPHPATIADLHHLLGLSGSDPAPSTTTSSEER